LIVENPKSLQLNRKNFQSGRRHHLQSLQ
jgi:hypothetical protein